jgi:hypothetical protein
MPKATMLPTHILKIIHHIHASTCITMCRVFMSGMWDSGLYRQSITIFQMLLIVVIFALSYIFSNYDPNRNNQHWTLPNTSGFLHDPGVAYDEYD